MNGIKNTLEYFFKGGIAFLFAWLFESEVMLFQDIFLLFIVIFIMMDVIEIRNK